MAIVKIDILQFIELSESSVVLDVRSEAEYAHAHFPKGVSLPLFNNDERKVIGTLYKQESREAAIKKGLEFFGPKMRMIVETVESILAGRNAINEADNRRVLVHCWRGGMRSGAIAWLLDLYGFEVYQLIGGYKAFRQWVLASFEKHYHFKILGGYTGSGKTKILSELKHVGHPVIDLEGLANHKGSAFGALGEKEQPTQEMFENLLAMELQWHHLNSANQLVWVEDESQRIGRLNIPITIWNQMRNCPIYFVDIDFETRLNYLVSEYGRFEIEHLMNGVMRIKKRLGGLEAKNAIGFLVDNNLKDCFRILLHYYDKLYSKGLHNRADLSDLLVKIPCSNVDEKENCRRLMTVDVSDLKNASSTSVNAD